ncbi:lantibiotic dehydratase [Salinispora arenicola]|uniref:lantibiotic dehydratase n=1 Tax=Salinispora arenicola TaxID=168697 RepID=UPI00036D485D|nr:lantibiotic dehydratase [Salinispora arenicola]
MRAVIAAAAAPIRVDALANAVAARFPVAAREKIRAPLDNLIDQHFRITNIRPPTTSPDGLTHLIHALRAAGGEDLPDIAELLQRLDEINGLLAGHNASPEPPRAAALRKFASVSMSALIPETSQVLAADVRLDATVALLYRRDRPGCVRATRGRRAPRPDQVDSPRYSTVRYQFRTNRNPPLSSPSS